MILFLKKYLKTKRSTLTFSAVSHAPLRGLKVVEQEVAAVAYCDGDAEETAVFGTAVEELPGGAGGQLADLARLWQRGVPQGQPHRSLRTTAIHLQQEQSLPPVRGVITHCSWTEMDY